MFCGIVPAKRWSILQAVAVGERGGQHFSAGYTVYSLKFAGIQTSARHSLECSRV
jgi:hypothetical protein